jgi:hypothetical protein
MHVCMHTYEGERREGREGGREEGRKGGREREICALEGVFVMVHRMPRTHISKTLTTYYQHISNTHRP